MNKVCSSCEKNLPLTTDFFYWHKDKRKAKGYGYFFYICKECCKEKSKLQFKKRGWIKGVTKHTPDELRRRRYQRFKNKINKDISYADYKPIDVLRQFLHRNKPILKKLEKKLKKCNPKKRKFTFAEKRHHIFCKYNVPQNERKNYSHYKNIQSLRYKVRYDYDSEFNLKERLRRQINKKMEKYPHLGDFFRADIKKNNNNFYVLLGYSIKDLKEHLEKYFSEGMTWKKFNHGEIHIDHIIPKCHFNLKDEKDIKACWSLENLQPLWAKDNIRKSKKIIYTKQAMEINPILAITWHLHKWRLVPQLLDEALQGLSDTHNQS